MKNLIVVRHGDYKTDIEENDLGLTTKGIDQIKRIGNSLVSHIRGNSDIFSSPLPRAFQSAGILKKTLGRDSKLEVWDELNCEYETLFSGQAKRINKKITNKDSLENVILVSHYAIKDYLKYFLFNQFGKKLKEEDFEKRYAIRLNLTNYLPEITYIPN